MVEDARVAGDVNCRVKIDRSSGMGVVLKALGGVGVEQVGEHVILAVVDVKVQLETCGIGIEGKGNF